MLKKIAYILLSFSLVACQGDDTQDDYETASFKYGYTQDTFGPADGPAFLLVLTDDSVSCDADRSSLPNTITTMYIDISLGDVSPGGLVKQDSQTAQQCAAGFSNCTDIGRLAMGISGKSTTNVTGEYFLQREGSTARGEYEVAVCPAQGQFVTP